MLGRGEFGQRIPELVRGDGVSTAVRRGKEPGFCHVEGHRCGGVREATRPLRELLVMHSGRGGMEPCLWWCAMGVSA